MHHKEASHMIEFVNANFGLCLTLSVSVLVAVRYHVKSVLRQYNKEDRPL